MVPFRFPHHQAAKIFVSDMDIRVKKIYKLQTLPCYFGNHELIFSDFIPPAALTAGSSVPTQIGYENTLVSSLNTIIFDHRLTN
jgi:hypothetical protein